MLENDLFKNKCIDNMTNKNDLFNHIKKGDAIYSILVNDNTNIEDNNMIALYGNWGSGKSTLMLYIKNRIDKEVNISTGSKVYKTIFFEAWKYEKDNNLALSLFHQIIDECSEDLVNLKDNASLIIETISKLGKNVLLNTKISLPGIELDIGKAGSETIDEVCDDYCDESSLFRKLSKFKEEFIHFENILLKKYKSIYIFIDDLDRCNSENVVELLTAIKLFFTQSNNIVYFCGIDKSAVTKALNIKYNDIIKSEEYLEKIFDITFCMPEALDLSRLINFFFENDSEKEYRYCKQLNNFFIQLKFTNPRHIKKIFNKLEILSGYTTYIEELKCLDIRNYDNILLLIFVIYLLILFEFDKDSFYNILDYKKRFDSYCSYYPVKLNSNNTKYTTVRTDDDNEQYSEDYFETLTEYYKTLDVSKNFFNNYNTLFSEKEARITVIDYINMFLPIAESPLRVGLNGYNRDNYYIHLGQFLNQFDNEKNALCVNFCRYIIHMHKNRPDFQPLSQSPIEICKIMEIITTYM